MPAQQHHNNLLTITTTCSQHACSQPCCPCTRSLLTSTQMPAQQHHNNLLTITTTCSQHACSQLCCPCTHSLLTSTQMPAHNLLTTCLLNNITTLCHNHNNLLTTCLLTAMLHLRTQLVYLYPNACSQTPTGMLFGETFNHSILILPALKHRHSVR